MNKIFGMAAIGFAVGMSGNLGVRAATPASVTCVTKAPLAKEHAARNVEGGEANQIGARNVEGGEANQIGARNVASGEANQFGARNVEGGEANQIGARNVAGVAGTPNQIGGENNAVYPSKTTQFVANTEHCG